MTLGAGTGQARDAHRTGVPSMASGAVADGSIAIRAPDAVALLAAAGHGRSALQLYEWVRGPASAAGLIGFREAHLLGRQPFSP